MKGGCGGGDLGGVVRRMGLFFVASRLTVGGCLALCFATFGLQALGLLAGSLAALFGVESSNAFAEVVKVSGGRRHGVEKENVAALG